MSARSVALVVQWHTQMSHTSMKERHTFPSCILSLPVMWVGIIFISHSHPLFFHLVLSMLSILILL